ncbi:MAG: CoA-binding protein [Deltaproteobacteria bacterium]|nr:CoA-binding protein [Deltaproteobacteria bacterium]
MIDPNDFEPLFEPRSVAVIGASNDLTKFGARTYAALKLRHFDGRLYAVNPGATEVGGDKAYSRVQEIPGELDMAIVAVAAPHVVRAIADCAEKRVRAVQILTAGFRETGSAEGARWEEQITRIARESGIKVVGPNCFGIYSPRSALTLLPGPDFPSEAGPVGVLSQSGGFAYSLVRKAMGLGIRFSQVVSYGNACDLNEADYLSHFEADDPTRMVCIYVEGVRDGRRFFEVARRTSLRKPIFIWKGGLTNLGSRAVASHTASLGGSKRIWEGFLRQTGAIPVLGIDEMIDLMVGFQCLPDFRGRRVCVVSGGGAITVEACDQLEPAGLSMPEFSKETQEAIRALLPASGNSVRNPLDTGPPVFLLPTVKPILEAVAASDDLDAVIVQHEVSSHSPDFVEEAAEVIPSVREASARPFLVTMPQPTSSSDSIEIEVTRRRYRERYLERGIPVFDTLQDAVRALDTIIRYNEWLARSRPQLRSSPR